MADQDHGSFTPEGGFTWPGWKQFWDGGGDVMLQAREDSIAFAGTAMHPGNMFVRVEDASVWKFDYYVAGDASQGGMMFQLQSVRS